MTIMRIPFQTEMRLAAVQLLTDFRQEFNIKLQLYPARPRTLNPPSAFVDRLRETIAFDGLRQRVVQVDIIVVHGLFDSQDAANQRDAFVDNFIDWTSDRYHAAGGSTVLEPRQIEDDPNFVAEWMPPERQFTYYATTIILEGFNGAGY
jgi:hypothetical protein